VAFGLEQRKLPAAEIRRRVQAMLEMVELPGREDRFPQQLSGGERQRVALARALVLEPAVLLLDEPLGALDQKLRQQMQVELKRLRQRLGITFIFVTHDQEEALVMSDRVAVIHQGCLEQVDTSEEIYERPRTRFVAEFLGVENFLEARRVAQTKDGTCFETAAGLPLWAADSRVGSPGSAATVAVRPESLRMSLAPPEPRPLNLIEAQVVEAIYEGGSRRWTLTLPGDMRLVAREANSSSALPTTGLAGGTKVYISWELCKSLVYPREGQA
jgi:ABC-type Fe3+/spermidine/putrescine transport system ATPase subunit